MSAPAAVEASPATFAAPEGDSASPRDVSCQVRGRRGAKRKHYDRGKIPCSRRRKPAIGAAATHPRPPSSKSFQPPQAPLTAPPRDDLLAPGRRLAVVSTAAPPWMTGTAVNPTLRAAFLAEALGCKREGEGGEAGERGGAEGQGPSRPPPCSSSPPFSPSRPPRVTLVVPWLNKTDQASLFPEGLLFDSPREQEKALRDWVSFFLSFFHCFFDTEREKLSFSPSSSPSLSLPSLRSRPARDSSRSSSSCGTLPAMTGRFSG